jgi:hypothetical protein
MEYYVLKHGLTVPKVFFQALFRQVKEIIPAMEPGVKYTLKVLCGEDFWSMYTDGQKRIAGQCMVYMVENGMLPIHFAEGLHEYSKLYRRP